MEVKQMSAFLYFYKGEKQLNTINHCQFFDINSTTFFQKIG